MQPSSFTSSTSSPSLSPLPATLFSTFVSRPLFVACAVFLFALSPVPLSAQETEAPVPPLPSDSTELSEPLSTDELPTVEAPATTETAEESLPVDSEGKVLLKTIPLSDFENADAWFGGMNIDDGLVQVRKIQGAPKPVRDANPDQARYALGVKVQFIRRTFSSVSIQPPVPTPIPGITKKLSLWVNGRGASHELFAVVRDLEGKLFKISFGKLNFRGWRKMEALIPNNNLIIQENPAFATFYQRRGLTFESFFVEFNPLQATGRTYFYLDNFSAESNLFLDEAEEQNLSLKMEERYDPIDDW